MIDMPPELAKLTPGAVGSFVSMLWIKETWPRKSVMFLAGAAMSHYGSPTVSKWSGLDPGFTGFLVGLFGMAIVAKIFDIWRGFELGSIFTEWVRKMLGLPPKYPPWAAPTKPGGL